VSTESGQAHHEKHGQPCRLGRCDEPLGFVEAQEVEGGLRDLAEELHAGRLRDNPLLFRERQQLVKDRQHVVNGLQAQGLCFHVLTLPDRRLCGGFLPGASCRRFLPHCRLEVFDLGGADSREQFRNRGLTA
jgi:hypothetical protein